MLLAIPLVEVSLIAKYNTNLVGNNLILTQWVFALLDVNQIDTTM